MDGKTVQICNNLHAHPRFHVSQPLSRVRTWWMSSILPPVTDDRKLALELRLVMAPDREDAIQEAWLAHLEGRNPVRAINTYARRERRYRRRMWMHGHPANN